MVALFYQLLRNNNKLKWGNDEQQVFDKLKYCLTNVPALVQADFHKTFYIVTDSSTVGVAEYLGQGEFENKVIQYASRTLQEHERKYTVTELECLAVLFLVDKFLEFLKGRSFVIYCAIIVYNG